MSYKFLNLLLGIQYDKEYASDEEYQKRLTIFMDNLIFIDNMSTKELSYESMFCYTAVIVTYSCTEMLW